MDTVNPTTTNKYTLPPATREPNVTVCRCCGGTLDAQWQSHPRREGFFMITCWNKTCGMEGFTLNDINYHEIDLIDYLCDK